MKRAVVIGGGIGGLASAKVLSAYFDKVIVYDAGLISQMHHLHILLSSGQDILENIFPGINKKFIEHQCLQIDWAQDTLWENHTGTFPRYPSSVKALSMGRVLLQDLMRESLNQVSNVEFIKKRIDSLDQIEADLIIISGGQNFPLKNFLGDVILREESKVIDLTYRSYQFRLKDLKMGDFKQYYFQVDPPYSFIGGVISPVGSGEAMVTLIEKEKSISPCQNLHDFLLKASQIQNRSFLEIIKDATPTTPLAIFRKKSTYQKTLVVDKIPNNVFILGDTLTSLNPVFGQGMTLTLMQVEILSKQLRDKKIDSRKFHKEIHKLGKLPNFLSLIGSSESGVRKLLLRTFLRFCQVFKPLHHIFLRELHSLGQKRQL